MTGYKLVTISYSEQATLVVKAETDDEAREAVLKTLEYIPGLTVVSIEDASEDVVRDAKSKAAELMEQTNRSLN